MLCLPNSSKAPAAPVVRTGAVTEASVLERVGGRGGGLLSAEGGMNISLCELCAPLLLLLLLLLRASSAACLLACVIPIF